jgi:hypothetical protein
VEEREEIGINMAIGIPTNKNTRLLNKLRDDGYSAYGNKTFSKSDVKKDIKKLHSEGFLARAVNLEGTRMEPDIGTRYLIMYKSKYIRR